MTEENKNGVTTPETKPEEEKNELTEEEMESEISKDLEEAGKTTESEQPTSVTPNPAVDINSLTPEQLRELKQRMDILPEEPEKPKTSTVQIRQRSEDGKYLVEIGKSRVAYLPNESGDRKVETHIIQVRFEGEKKLKDMNYREFMHLDQVVCVVKDKVERKEIVPQVSKTSTDKKTGRVISLNTTKVQATYTIETPEGRTLQVESNIVNA